MALVPGTHLRIETFILCERIERHDLRAAQYLGKSPLFVSRSIGVGTAAKLLQCQAGFVGRGSRGVADVFTEDREGLPEGVGFEGQDKLHTGTLGNTFDEGQVAT